MMAQICDVKGMWHEDAVIEEKREIQQPSGAYKECQDPGDSPDDGSASSCGDDNSCCNEDDYYAFLREMAGSFEASYDDDEEGDGSEIEVEAEEEQSGSRKRSSSFWLDPRPISSLASAGGLQTRAHVDGKQESSAAKEMAPGFGDDKPKKPGAPWSGSGSTGSTSAATPSESQGLSDLSDSDDDRSVASDDTDDESRPLVPTPSHDHRPPVVDSYDVVEAVKHFASQRGADPKQQKREDLLAAIKMKDAQIKQLRTSSKKAHVKLELRSHYAKVLEEIETEVSLLEKDLAAL
eukprot:CAMPEP_0181447866 /NCGR_PEP_ID=MMETSP1110-20121109/26844_1 /TAXON_ID=174948 /ORGANISM="Symbiodinium sp., Strain CCMP421" /LENGTH=292 /DNA_ID=CAMNT_0023571995 /DNA_START=84 /DNA_END=962 /DNA_ORIENTATION=+